MAERQEFDVDAYIERTRNGPCFICELVSGNPEYAHHIIHQDEDLVVFLSKYPTLPGYCLVSPRRHVEDLSADITEAEYLHLHQHVFHISRALKQVFDAERIYILSLGSKQGNAHLHWQVVLLPKGVPYDKQQYHALMAENGILNFSAKEMSAQAANIRAALNF